MTRGPAVGVALLLGGYLLVTSTVTLSETLWQYDVKRILELCLLPLIFTAVLLNGALRAGFRDQLGRIPRWLAAALGLLLGLGILSSIYTSNSVMSLIYSLSEVSLLTLLTLAVLCVAACRRAAGTLFDQTALLLLTLVALAVGLQELLGVLAAWNSGLEFHPRIALLHFSWPRFYNQVQSWSIPVIAALPLVFPGKPLARLMCVAALALEWYVVVATGGRGSMVAVSFAILTTALLLPAIRKTLAQYQLAGLLAGLLIYALVVIGHQHLKQGNLSASAEPNRSVPTENATGKTAPEAAALHAIGDSSGHFLEPVTGKRIWTSSGRLPMWRDALQDAASHPLLGIGPMNYACTGPTYRAAHPHNFALQFMAEWGIPAFLLLLLVAAFLFFSLLRNLQKTGVSSAQVSPLGGFLAAGMLAASIHACLSGVLVMPASQVAGVLTCGWLLGILPTPPRVRAANLPGSIVLISGLVLSIAFLSFAVHEIGVSETRWEQTALMDRGIPRLWQNGKVCRLYRQE